MTNQDEIRRLREGPAPAEHTNVSCMAEFTAYCPGNASDVLRRCKEVLEVVLTHSHSNQLSVYQWRSMLPEWFVERSGEEISQEEAEERLLLPFEERIRLSSRWSVSAFIYWFQSNERYWFWWNGTVTDANTLKVVVITQDSPFPSGSLMWLLRASGAVDVEES